MNRRRIFLAAEAKLSARVRRSFLLFFDQTIPLIAVRTAPQPLGGLITAALTGIDDFSFSHWTKEASLSRVQLLEPPFPFLAEQTCVFRQNTHCLPLEISVMGHERQSFLVA